MRGVVTTRLHNRQNPSTPALWFPAYAGMTVMRCRNDGLGVVDVVLFTLTFDSSAIKGEGDSVGWVLCFEGFDCFVAEVVDDFDGDAARCRDRERTGYVAFDGVPSFSVYLGFQGGFEGFVRVVAGA